MTEDNPRVQILSLRASVLAAEPVYSFDPKKRFHGMKEVKSTRYSDTVVGCATNTTRTKTPDVATGRDPGVR